MKLIKINTDHYVIVDDSEIREKSGDWFYSFETGKIYDTLIHHTAISCKKITHSTQPLDKSLFFTDRIWGCERLSLGEVKELIGEVDVEKKAEELTKHLTFPDERKEGIVIGYNQAIEDNKDKKYTEEDLRKAYLSNGPIEDNDKGFNALIQSLQPKTEWEVYFDENGKLCKSM